MSGLSSVSVINKTPVGKEVTIVAFFDRADKGDITLQNVDFTLTDNIALQSSR
jgi:hypothetical protein